MNALFDEWRPLVLAEAGHFVGDGIVLEEAWRASKRRILFVLKETNGYEGEKGPMDKLLRDAAKPGSTSKLWDRPTFHNLGRWAHGLLTYTGEVPGYEEAHRARRSAMLACAFINLKKSSGGRTATEEVGVHAGRYAEQLRRQVEIIQPEIVVLGGTYPMVKEHVFPGLEKVSSRVHKLGDRIFINAFHPACTKDRREGYHQVVLSYHQYMIGGPSEGR
ncbi:hypothetical protein LJR290_007720 [Variovorax sp. LjRoot290]